MRRILAALTMVGAITVSGSTGAPLLAQSSFQSDHGAVAGWSQMAVSIVGHEALRRVMKLDCWDNGKECRVVWEQPV